MLSFFFLFLLHPNFVNSNLCVCSRTPPLHRGPRKPQVVEAPKAKFSLSDWRSRKRVLLQEGWARPAPGSDGTAMLKLWNAFQTQVPHCSWHLWAAAGTVLGQLLHTGRVAASTSQGCWADQLPPVSAPLPVFFMHESKGHFLNRSG